MSIQDEMNQLIHSFSQASEGLFEVTGIYGETFEGGVYRCAIAKPTKRMRAALSADREVLIVASSFTDQQQRTIKFIKKEIETSQGRYEKSVAIIIHKDAYGNNKLRNWGRDQGIAILPIYGEEVPANSIELEKCLCYELYTHDSFDVTGPVSDDSNFFGRRDEAIDLARKLQKGQIRSCLGIRKVGKTSIINRIIREIERTYECLCLMIDCSRDDVWGLDAPNLLNAISKSIEALSRSGSTYASISPITDSVEMKSARESLETIVMSCQKPVVIIFDEIDYITPGSPTNAKWSIEFNSLWRNFRSIYQECDRQGKNLSILVGGVSTHWFCVESIGGVENAALAFIPEEYLSPMPEGATVAMLKRLGKISGLSFDESASVTIARATGNMPYWARKCGSYVHRHVPTSERPCSVSSSRVKPLVEAFVLEEGAAVAEVALRHLFRVNPDLQDAASRCCAGQAESVPEPLKRRLRRYGVLTTSGELSGQMLTQAFDSIQLEQCVTKMEPEEKAKPLALGLNEWAEEIAALGKRRNLLEHRLRELAINFIRFDALASGQQQDVKDRVLVAVNKKNQKEMQHLTAEEVVRNYNWTDLVALVTREWKLFERLLGDKSEFKRNSEIVNDRFDAHAKPADSADIGLYRRALRQLEERISKIQ